MLLPGFLFINYCIYFRFIWRCHFKKKIRVEKKELLVPLKGTLKDNFAFLREMKFRLHFSFAATENLFYLQILFTANENFSWWFLVHKKELLVPLEIILKIHFYVKQKLV